MLLFALRDSLGAVEARAAFCDVVRLSGRVRMPSAFGRAEDRADGHPRECVAVSSTAAPSLEDADAGPRQHSV